MTSLPAREISGEAPGPGAAAVLPSPLVCVCGKLCRAVLREENVMTKGDMSWQPGRQAWHRLGFLLIQHRLPARAGRGPWEEGGTGSSWVCPPGALSACSEGAAPTGGLIRHTCTSSCGSGWKGGEAESQGTEVPAGGTSRCPEGTTPDF